MRDIDKFHIKRQEEQDTKIMNSYASKFSSVEFMIQQTR